MFFRCGLDKCFQVLHFILDSVQGQSQGLVVLLLPTQSLGEQRLPAFSLFQFMIQIFQARCLEFLFRASSIQGKVIDVRIEGL